MQKRPGTAKVPGLFAAYRTYGGSHSAWPMDPAVQFTPGRFVCPSHKTVHRGIVFLAQHGAFNFHLVKAGRLAQRMHMAVLVRTAARRPQRQVRAAFDDSLTRQHKLASRCQGAFQQRQHVGARFG